MVVVLDVFSASTVFVAHTFIKSYDILVHILNLNKHPLTTRTKKINRTKEQENKVEDGRSRH